jgi:microcystin-dependent protein
MSTKNCSNCFNGCAEIVSDQCVRYTGVDVPLLGIQNGDSLSYVEQALITFLTAALDGTGIKPTIDPEIICELVQQYLPDCEDLNATNLFIALIKAACDLQEQIDAIVADIAVIEAPYTVDCLDGVTPTSGTHNILQAVITKLCTLVDDFDAFVLDVETNYVKKSELCALVAACTPAPVVQYKDRMVPYTVVEYYGSLSNFDGAGIGIPANGFEDIYLCNGANGTPDKRGRIPVGAIQAVPGGGALNPAVDPSIAGNPNYALNTTTGANTITLTSAQMPSHTHAASTTLVDPGHSHLLVGAIASGASAPDPTSSTFIDFRHDLESDLSYRMTGSNNAPTLGKSETKTTGIFVGVANDPTGGGQSHNNIPPVLACYYIMYIP